MTDKECARSRRNASPATRRRLLGGMPRWVAFMLGLLAAGVVAVPALAGLALALLYPQLPDVEGLADYRPKQSMRITSADGVLLAEFGEERRRFVPIAQIPKVMQDAVLAIEDARFYQHGGVDYLGVLRAGLANFGEARSQGASTITMQVARNFYLSREKTFSRKLYEILLSLKIERQLGKERILELYMNQIYLGQRAYGFAAAAETYFGKPLEQVSIAEAAMLAGLPKAPSAYNPVANPRRATIRQQYIIDRMLEGGFITQAQHDAAKREALRYRAPSDVVHAEYAAETARQLLFSQYGEEAYTRGFNVQLTLRAEEQKAAYQALRRGLMDYERRQAYRGPEAHVDLPADPKELDLRIAEALNDHPDNGELRAAVVLEASPRQVVAVLQSGESITVTGDGLKPVAAALFDKAAAQKQIRRGAVVRAVKGAKGDWMLTQQPAVEGAFVALDPRDGSIRALVGGFDWHKNQFNHVTQAWRQPGSSFKPFIYSAALEKGFMPATLVDDAPLALDSGGTVWEPRNDDGVYDGPTTLRRALAQSKNVVAVRLLQAVGAQEAQRWVTRFGFEADKHPAYPTMALGAGSVTPMQLASAYAVFANGGHLLTPTLIRRVTDADGHVLFDAAAQARGEDNRAISERNAFVTGSLLQEVTRSGTAAKVQATLKRADLYGKTGTTSDAMDAWFAGFQPGLVAVAWIGHDQPRSLGAHEFGATLAVPVWTEFMQRALRDVPVQALAPPAGVRLEDGDWAYDPPLTTEAPPN